MSSVELNAAVHDQNTFFTEESSLLNGVSGPEMTSGSHHPPPGDIDACGAEQRPDGAGCSRMARLRRG